MNCKKISLVLIVLILTFSIFSLSTVAQENIDNMNFHNAELVDVLRSVAELADVNLITDSQVSGRITVNLKDISFEKALDLITKTRGLDYRWDENTVVVAEPERLDNIYNDIVTKYVEFNSSDFDNIATIVKEVFPKTQITIDAARRQFIIKGEKEKTAEIIEMVNRLDTAQNNETKLKNEAFKENKIKIYNESYNVLNADIKDLESKLRTINPDVTFKTNPLTNIMTFTGAKNEVKEALSMAKTYDQSLEPETRNIRVDYVDTDQISEIVGNFYPKINLHVNKKRKEIIINGAKNKLDNVAELIKEINKPQYQVVIETRVEEISSSKLRELGIEGELSAIHFIKDKADPIISDGSGDDNNNENSYQTKEYGQIDKLELTWPDFFNAIEENSDSTTLAQPTLMTLNGEKATMSILDERPYELKTENDNENSEITWEYAEAGVILDFTPWITKNNEIELQISPEVSSFTSATTDEGAPPAKKSRRIETKLRLKDGETFAIGGLIQTDEAGVITKIPLLGDIPLLGEIFKTRSNDGRQSELIIFVTPHIIKYGDEINTKNVINPENKELAADIQQEIKLEEKSNQEEKELKKSKKEIINEYLEERRKNREEILKSIQEDKEQNNEYQDLSPEELEAILEK